MKVLKNYTGRRTGIVTIVREIKDGKVRLARPGQEVILPRQWLLRCDCGVEWVLQHAQISPSGPRACRACTPKMRAPQVPAKIGKYLKREHPSYGSWYAMIRRCNSKIHASYERYGGRGITVCARWLSFDNFVEDMGERPPNHTIERVDNEQGYTPQNCVWATAKEQAANRRKPSKSKYR